MVIHSDKFVQIEQNKIDLRREKQQEEHKIKTKAVKCLLLEYKNNYAKRLNTIEACNPPTGWTCDNPFSPPSDLPVASMKVHSVASLDKEELYRRLKQQNKLHKLVGSNVDDIDDIHVVDMMFNEYIDTDEIPNWNIINNDVVDKPVENPSPASPAPESGAQGSQQELSPTEDE